MSEVVVKTIQHLSTVVESALTTITRIIKFIIYCNNCLGNVLFTTIWSLYLKTRQLVDVLMLIFYTIVSDLHMFFYELGESVSWILVLFSRIINLFNEFLVHTFSSVYLSISFLIFQLFDLLKNVVIFIYLIGDYLFSSLLYLGKSLCSVLTFINSSIVSFPETVFLMLTAIVDQFNTFWAFAGSKFGDLQRQFYGNVILAFNSLKESLFYFLSDLLLGILFMAAVIILFKKYFSASATLPLLAHLMLGTFSLSNLLMIQIFTKLAATASPLLRYISNFREVPNSPEHETIFERISVSNLTPCRRPTIARKMRLSSSALCVICQEVEKSIILFPCRHLCLCEHCRPLLQEQSNRCPICRQVVNNFYRVYT